MTKFRVPEIDDSQAGLLRRLFEGLQATKDEIGAEKFYRKPESVFYTFLLHYHLGSPNETIKDALARSIERHRNAIGEQAFAVEPMSHLNIEEIIDYFNRLR